MTVRDLEDIKKYWEKKYPQITITFYPMHDDGKYRGKMRTPNESFDLLADTIGEIIGQGESFLRRIKR
jgi:aspartyl/asparaginyl-tRNA synthetase